MLCQLGQFFLPYFQQCFVWKERQPFGFLQYLGHLVGIILGQNSSSILMIASHFIIYCHQNIQLILTRFIASSYAVPSTISLASSRYHTWLGHSTLQLQQASWLCMHFMKAIRRKVNHIFSILRCHTCFHCLCNSNLKIYEQYIF